MSKLNLDNVPSLVTAPGVINTNNEKIENEFDKVLYRDGTQPNAMFANIDMNGFRVTNLPTPVSPVEPVRKQEFDAALGNIVGAQGFADAAQASATAAAASASASASSASTAESFYNLLTARITISTLDPSGGNEGDIWFKVA